MLMTIKASGDGIPPGNYNAAFEGIEATETKSGKAWRWTFKADDGRKIVGISDRETNPTVKNKTGRWLAALA